MEKYKISVIIPAYNVEPYISECINSIINQSYSNLEIIIINDGSKDSTLNIIRKFEKEDNRIIVIDKPNEGVSNARNDGIKKATGEYIMFVDADDWIDKETCEVALENIIKNSADIVMFGYVREYENKSLPKSIFAKDCIFENLEVKEKIHRRLIGPYTKEELSHPEKLSSLAPVAIKLYKKSIITNTLFRDIKEVGYSGEDAYFNIEIMPNVNKVVYLDKFFYHYRKTNTTSITHSIDKDLHKKDYTHYIEIKKLIEKQNVDETFFEALDNHFAINIIAESLSIFSCNSSKKEKKELLKSIILNQEYIRCIKKLDTSSMPIHWKVFFFCVKHKIYVAVNLLVIIMKKLATKF